MGRVKRGSLNYQISERMKALDCIGEKRHIAKQDYKEYCERHDIEYRQNKTVGIYSHGSYEAIKQTMTEFTSWVKEHDKNVRNIEDITRQHMKEYLQERNNLSAYTVNKDMSAINKVFNMDLTKEECGLKSRSYKNITRSRGSNTTTSKKYNPDNYKEQIAVAKATGIRRQSMLKIAADDFERDADGIVTGVKVKEKGGLTRVAPVLKEQRKNITKIVDSKPRGQAMFTKYSKAIDNHSFRAEYAIKLYKEYASDKMAQGIAIDKDHRGYNKEILGEVSIGLGHKRIDVVVENYLSNSKAQQSVEQQDSQE